MSDSPSYAVPWSLVFGLGPHIIHRTPTSVDAFSARICQLMCPAPAISGWDQLPQSPRFVLIANHYQRQGLWILYPAAVLTQAIRRHYGPGDPPVRWIVTANWPRIKLGPLSFPSPGDVLLPRVADALSCYPVSFAGSNHAFTARTLRRVLRDAPRSNRPLGIFPEGVRGTASRLTEPLHGVGRLLTHLAQRGMPVQPAAIAESQGRLTFQFGATVATSELLTAPDPANLCMQRLADLL